MRDAVATKKAIIKTAGELFNVQGYKATSISDITKKLGMTKGAIYRHFQSKAELEKASLDHMTSIVLLTLNEKIKEKKDVKSKLFAILDFFRSYVRISPIPGGCPLLNAGVEADDNNPELKERLAVIIRMLHQSIGRVLNNGIRYKQLKEDIDVRGFSSLLFSSLEGAIMMSKVSGKTEYMDDVVKSLKTQIEYMLI